MASICNLIQDEQDFLNHDLNRVVFDIFKAAACAGCQNMGWAIINTQITWFRKCMLCNLTVIIKGLLFGVSIEQLDQGDKWSAIIFPRYSTIGHGGEPHVPTYFPDLSSALKDAVQRLYKNLEQAQNDIAVWLTVLDTQEKRDDENPLHSKEV